MGTQKQEALRCIHRYALGGAGNVAQNVRAVGAGCDLVATAGDDVGGRQRLERTQADVAQVADRGGNQVQAARLLGITRGSLRNKIRTLGISIARLVWSDDGQDDG